MSASTFKPKVANSCRKFSSGEVSGHVSISTGCPREAFAVTGHLVGVVFLPVSWFINCHALRLEWEKSVASTNSVHFALYFASSLSSNAVAVGTVGRWCDQGNLSITCLSGVGSPLQRTANARSGLVKVHLSEE